MKKFDTTFKARPLSWSCINSFEYDKNSWYENYFLGNRSEGNSAMEAGKRIGKEIAAGTSPIPMPKYEHYEYKLSFKIGKIHCIGYIDGYTPSILGEFKTSANRKKWTQKSVDEHRQLHMYTLGLYLQDKIRPEDIDIILSYIPVYESGDFTVQWTGEAPIHFHTRRTLREVMAFANYVKKTVKEMEVYVNSRELSTGVGCWRKISMLRLRYLGHKARV